MEGIAVEFFPDSSPEFCTFQSVCLTSRGCLMNGYFFLEFFCLKQKHSILFFFKQSKNILHVFEVEIFKFIIYSKKNLTRCLE